GAWLARRSLEGVDLREADLARANLEGADLYKLNGSRANFRNARLKGAVLHRAIALEANFSGADFTAADLSSAALRGSIFLRRRYFHGRTRSVRSSCWCDLTSPIFWELVSMAMTFPVR